MRHFALSSGRGRHRVWGTALLMPTGVTVQLVGGDRPHVGAVAVSLPGPRPSTSVLTLPGHREDELIQPLAGLLAATLRRTAAIVAGIHVDGATAGDIAKLVTNARRAVTQLIAMVRREDSRAMPGGDRLVAGPGRKSHASRVADPGGPRPGRSGAGRASLGRAAGAGRGRDAGADHPRLEPA